MTRRLSKDEYIVEIPRLLSRPRRFAYSNFRVSRSYILFRECAVVVVVIPSSVLR